MNIKLLAALLGAVGLLAVGCSVDTNEPVDGEAEKAETSEAQLHSYVQALAGAYHGDFHAGTQLPAFDGIVFKKDGSFFADVQTGIVCITTPCPTQARISGRFYATKTWISLYSISGDTLNGVGSMGGWYRYNLNAGHKLSLERPWNNGWQQSLAPETSYCAAPVDCKNQDLAQPRCLGEWTCGASAQNQCKFQCGPVGSAIWPSTASKLVARNSGGGFTPPPPPGSNCAVGASKYTFDRQTNSLDWEECGFVDWNTPLTAHNGTKVLSAAEVAKVNQAMNAVVLSTQMICGADKPLLTLEVTSPTGVKKYTDNFYSCMGDGPFVDNIDGVFSTMREVAH